MAAAPVSETAARAFNAANAAWRDGDPETALTAARRAAEAAPELIQAHVLQGRALGALGRRDEAAEAYRAALRLDAANFDAALELGHTMRGLGRPDQAAEWYRRASAARPEDARPQLALARLEEERADPAARDRAAVAFARALDLARRRPNWGGPFPGPAGICREISVYRLERGETGAALDALRLGRLLLGQEPAEGQAEQLGLGIAECLLRLGMMPEAGAEMQRLAASSRPAFLVALARLAYRFKYWEEALDILRRAGALAPGDAGVQLALAETATGAWRLDEADAAIDRAAGLAEVPSTVLRSMRATIALRRGDAEAAARAYRANWQNGGGPREAAGFLMSLLYLDAVSAAEKAELHAKACAAWGEPRRMRPADTDPERPLRIGMVTGDLHHQHPVNIFMQPLLARWDHARLPLTVFYTGTTVDDQTRLARHRATNWRQVTAETLADAVEADAIDVLVDLAGHTKGGTLPVLARRIAPVQATYLGYPFTTGVPNIDWLIGDPVVTPEDDAYLYSERIFRLPDAVFCYAPERDYPLPDFAAAADRPLTFGSFNNVPKLTPAVVECWSTVLAATPGSRLLLRAPSFAEAAVADRFRDLFAAQGIEAERLVFRGPLGLDAMMAAYADLDIALDPFPYGGGTTTLQALWMGVPVLTLQRDGFAGRMGASFLTAAGLPDWIATTPAEYVDKATRHARNRADLLTLKSSLRARLLERPGWNPDRFARAFQAAMRSIWQQSDRRTEPVAGTSNVRTGLT